MSERCDCKLRCYETLLKYHPSKDKQDMIPDSDETNTFKKQTVKSVCV